MFLTTKLNLLTGVLIGASAVLLMKQMCTQRSKQKHTSSTMASQQEMASSQD
tara:strand:- start:334 stop:489 length:156 start_codon:yes stop_codon:yes gene_type:complete